MNILIYRWNAYIYRDVELAFIQLGHCVENFEYDLNTKQVDIDIAPGLQQKLKGILQNHKYDFVFSVNYFSTISEICQQIGIKYVCWNYDNPVLSMYHRSVFNENNYIFTFDKTCFLEFRQMGVEHIWYLPLAAPIERADYLFRVGNPAISENKGQHSKYMGDIAFVGSLYENNIYNQICDTFPDYLAGYFDAVMEAQLNISGANIIDALLTVEILEKLQKYYRFEKSEDSFVDLGFYFQTGVLGFKIAELQRQRALTELSKKFSVNVYSNSDFSDLYRVCKKGAVDYWQELPLVFRQSKINLNFTIPNIKSGIPLRVWDVLAAGGFLMTNYQAELPYYFEEGKELVCFDGVDDLCEKVEYYLENEEERMEIAKNGYEKVRHHHSYRHRISEMFALMDERL